MGSHVDRTMLALRLQPGASKEAIETVPVPTVGPFDVLVKVKAAGLAPGVLTLGRAGLLQSLPATLGHEVAGTVEVVGEQVKAIGVGTRVRIHSNVSCRTCEFCLSDRDQMCPVAGLMGFQGFAKRKATLFETYRDGGLSDYIRAPFWLVDELPDNVSFDVGAKLHEVATALCTLRKAGLTPGSTVIITAPTGAVGTCLLKLAEFFSIYRIILVGRSSERLEAVRKLTRIKVDIIALDKLSQDWVGKKELARVVTQTVPEGADAFIDLTPSGTDMWQALAGLGTNGTFVHLGANSSVLPLPMVAIMANCWKIVGTRNHSRNDALTVLSWLKMGRLNVEDLITHKWAFSEIETAIERIRDRSLPIWMCIINF
jgi:threonine dehydrogenase-like Zn-dependent dehydrogenase